MWSRRHSEPGKRWRWLAVWLVHVASMARSPKVALVQQVGAGRDAGFPFLASMCLVGEACQSLGGLSCSCLGLAARLSLAPLQCEVLWAAAGTAAGDGPQRNAIERVALDLTDRIGAVARLVCAHSIYHVVKVPRAAALPPDTGRGGHPCGRLARD